jgi:hypothetical protein
MRGICSLLAVLIGFGFQNDVRSEARRKAAEHREQAMQLNEMAAHINSEAESERFVDHVADMFKDELPPSWATLAVRQRVARAEYKAATDQASLIPEERIADVWNEYVREIAAPDEAIVTAAEIHNLRDALYAGSQELWDRDINRSVWTMPNIVATGPDGKVANGCRAVEAVGVIYSMGRLFENVRAARERLQQGIIASDQMAKRSHDSASISRKGTLVILKAATNPISGSEQRYIREHGQEALNRVFIRLFGELFPDESTQQK